MTHLRPKARLFVEAPLAGGAAVDLSPSQAKYLGAVMRLGPGDAVSLFNGRDGEWLARVAKIAKGQGRLVAERMTRPQSPEPDLWLAFAPVKKTGTDFIVQKATELGASRLLPVFTRHTASERVKTERLAANALEAAEQCERLSLPEVAEPVSLKNLLDSWPGARLLIVADERGGDRPVAEALRTLAEGGGWRQRAFGILTGPEGGFAPGELDLLAGRPFVVRVTLGPRILRAETAALSLLACWQAVLGDWGAAPLPRP